MLAMEYRMYQKKKPDTLLLLFSLAESWKPEGKFQTLFIHCWSILSKKKKNVKKR